MPAQKSRLNSEDWLRAGLSALAETGPDTLKAEPLARALGTTKGSFYWHFKDVPEFHARLAGFWEQRAVATLAEAAEANLSPTERLHRLPELTAPTEMPPETEAAIRTWARTNHTVANALSEVDAARLAYLGTVLHALGLTNPDFARLLYGAHLGMLALPGTAAENDSALSTLTAALLALQDA